MTFETSCLARPPRSISSQIGPSHVPHALSTLVRQPLPLPQPSLYLLPLRVSSLPPPLHTISTSRPPLSGSPLPVPLGTSRPPLIQGVHVRLRRRLPARF